MNDADNAPVERHRPNWRLPLAVSAGGTVLGGLILAALLQLADVLGGMSAGQVLLYVVLPAIAVGWLASSIWLLRRLFRVYTDWWDWRLQLGQWRDTVTEHLLELGGATRRVYLREVIAVAETNAWRVYDDEDHDLVLVSPDGDHHFITDIAPSAAAVAEELNNLSPHHFPEDWREEVDRLAGFNDIDPVIESLHDRLVHLEHAVPAGDMRAILTPVAAEAMTRGWQVGWGGNYVEFVRNGDMATVRFNEPLDLIKLRRVLGLDGKH